MQGTCAGGGGDRRLGEQGDTALQHLPICTARLANKCSLTLIAGAADFPAHPPRPPVADNQRLADKTGK